MFHTIISVQSLPNFKLHVCFENGIEKEYDIKTLLSKIDAFRAFELTPGLFKCVKLDTGGYGISWNDDLDLSADELWEHGKTVVSPFNGLLSFKEATDFWGLNESTLRKAVTYGKLVDGVDVKKFGKQWIVTKEAMQREYGEPKGNQ